MRVRRDISSIPQRSASETWQRIIDLVTGTDSRDADQLIAAAGVMGSIITDEHPETRPIVLEGAGPQLRLYCRYGMDAVEEGNAVDALNWNATAGDWTMHVPCDSENMAWVKASLSKTAPRLRVYDVADEEHDDTEKGASARGTGAIVIDWNVRR
jgi:hypothetical protein